MTALTTPAARFEPGPWYALPRWKKAIVWLRYRPLAIAKVLVWTMPITLWYWYVVYRDVPLNEFGDKQLSWIEIDDEYVDGMGALLPSPRHALSLYLSGAGQHEMGRYSTMVWEEGETE